jgi:hypothetical protein
MKVKVATPGVIAALASFGAGVAVSGIMNEIRIRRASGQDITSQAAALVVSLLPSDTAPLMAGCEPTSKADLLIILETDTRRGPC